MSNSIRFAVIGLIGALMVPSLCSAQLIILHENWHGLGASKVAIDGSPPRTAAISCEAQDKRLVTGTAPRVASVGIERAEPVCRVSRTRASASAGRRASLSFIGEGGSRPSILKLLQRASCGRYRLDADDSLRRDRVAFSSATSRRHTSCWQ